MSVEEGWTVDGGAGVRVARAVHAERCGSERCCDGQVLDERDDDELVVSRLVRVFYGVGAGGAEVRVELEEAADDALGDVFLAFGGFGTADDELYEALGVGEGAEGCEYAPQDDGELEVRRTAAPAAESIFAD